jgi:hypothetical protein
MGARRNAQRLHGPGGVAAGDDALHLGLRRRGEARLPPPESRLGGRGRQKTPLQVEFQGARAWPVEATARAHIDSDGPGLFFTVEPGAGANSFLAAFTSAEGMNIRRAGARVDTLPLAGSRTAISGLAHCLADRWNAPGAAPGDASEAEAPGESI